MSLGRGQHSEEASGILEILVCVKKIYEAYNFFLTGPGVPWIIERTSEMKTSDELRSELCCGVLSESA